MDLDIVLHSCRAPTVQTALHAQLHVSLPIGMPQQQQLAWPMHLCMWGATCRHPRPPACMHYTLYHSVQTKSRGKAEASVKATLWQVSNASRP